MGRSIDERIVQMKFENGQFERNIQTSIKSVNELKQGLDFEGSVKGFDELDKAAKGLNFNPITNSIDALTNKFSWANRTIMRQIDQLTDKAINAGKTLVKSLSSDNISAGWDKYANKTSAVQTIMSATANQFEDTGKQMEFVNEQLDKLNWFTDETSYRFLDMVSNIGKFTSNNIELDKSVIAMQGIATWAAQSGANATEAGRAMYNLSQAIATGAVTLIDWKSIENANMATASFKEQVIEAAEAAGMLKKAGDGMWKTLSGKDVSVSNFNENLSEKWFTSDVLMDVLEKYGNAATALQMVSENVDRSTSSLIRDVQDYAAGVKTAAEISDLWDKDLEATQVALEGLSTEEMLFGLKAFAAAQETKTFGEAIDYVKEAVSTGWMNTFELIFGDYEQAKEFWSNISEVLYSLFVESSEARNDMLRDWSAMGGRAEFIDTIYGGLSLLLNTMKALKSAWADIFPSMTAERLFDITHALHEMMNSIIENDEWIDKLKRTARGLFSILNILKMLIVGGVQKAFKLINTLFGNSNVSILDFTANIGDSLYALQKWVAEETFLNDALDAMIDRIAIGVEWVKQFIAKVQEIPVVQAVITGVTNIFKGFFDDISNFSKNSSGFFEKFAEKFKELPKIASISDIKILLKSLWDLLVEAATDLIKLFPNVSAEFGAMVTSIVANLSFLKGPFDKVIGLLGDISGGLTDFVSNISMTDVALLGLSVGVFKSIREISKSVTAVGKAVTSVTSIFDVFGKAINALKGAFKKNLNAKAVRTYAEAILILAASLYVLTKLDTAKLLQAGIILVSLGGGVLAISFAMSKMKASDFAPEKFTLMSTAILLLASSLLIISKNEKIGTSLVVLASIITSLGLLSVTISKWAKEMDKGGKTILAFSVSVLVLVSALKKLGRLDVDEVKQGIVGLMLILTTLAAAIRLMNGSTKIIASGDNAKVLTSTAKSGAAILAFAVSVHIIIAAFKAINKLQPETILGGLAVIAAIFVEIGIAMKLLAKSSEKDYAKVGGTLLALSVAINLMVPALKGLAKLDKDTMGTALINLGAISLVFMALIAASNVAGQYSARAGLMLIEMAAAMAIMPIIVRIMGSIKTEELVKGTTAVIFLGAMFAQVVKQSKTVRKATASLIVMTAMIGTLSYTVYQLAKLDFVSVISSASAMSILLLSLAGSFKIIGSVKNSLLDEGKTLAAMTAMVAVVDLLAMIVTELAKITNPAGAIGGAAAIALIMPSLAVSMRILGKTEALKKDVLVQLGAMSLVVTALGLVIAGISAIPGVSSGKAIGIVTATSLLIAALTGSYAALGLLSKNKITLTKATTEKFAIFAAIAGALGLVIAALSKMTNIDTAFDVAQVLSLFLLELSGVFVILSAGTSKVRIKKDAMTQFAIFATITGALGLVINGLASMPNVENAVYAASALGLLMPALTSAMYILAKSKTSFDAGQIAQFAAFAGITSVLGLIIAGLTQITNAEAAIPVVTALDLLIVPLAAVVAGLSLIPTINPSIIANAASVAAAIDVIVVIVGGLMGLIGYIAQDPVVAASLESAPYYCTLLGEAIGGLFGGLIGGLVGGAIGGVTTLLPILGTNLSLFAENMQPFFDMVSDLDDSLLNKANLFTGVIIALAGAEFATALSTLGSGIANVINGVLGFDTDKVESFRHLGEAINAFAEGIGDIDAAKVTAAAQAAEILSALEDNIPPVGGMLSEFLGSKDIGLFGERLQPFAEGLRKFADETEGITEESVTGAAAAGKILIALEEGVPRQGGYLQTFLGSQDIGLFGERLVSFGESLASYAEKTKGITDNSVTGSAAAAKALIELENGLVLSGGLLQTLIGSQDFGQFGIRLVSLGGSLTEYINTTKNISENDVKGSSAAISALAAVEKELDTTGGIGSFFFGDSSFGNFAKNLKDLGNALGSYGIMIGGVDVGKMNLVTYALKSLLSLSELIKDSTNWSSNVKLALDGWITTVGSDFSSYEQTITGWGKEVVSYILAGITVGINGSTITVNLQMLKLTNSMLTAFDNMLKISNGVSDEFVQNGSYIIAGLVKGVDQNEYKITDKMISLAQKINIAFQDEMLIASPSVVMKENGIWLVKGIAEGIDSDTSAEDAITKKAQNIASAFKSEIERLSIYSTQSSLAYQLWEANEGRNATDEEKTKRELDSMVDELDWLAKDVSVYRAALEAAAKEFGETSQQYVEAENTMNEALLKMYQQRNEIEDKIKELNEAANESQESSEIDMAEAFVNYSNYLHDLREVADQLGYTEEQLDTFARERSGYKPVTKTESNIPEYDLDAVIAKAFDTQAIEFAVEEVAKVVETKSTTTVKTAGKTVGQSLNAGVQEAVAQETPKTSLNFLQGLADGLADKDGIVSKASNLIGVDKMLGALQGSLDENSPSKEAYKIGDYFIQGLANGITETSYRSDNSSRNAGISALRSLSENKEDFYQYGAQTMEGFAKGIRDLAPKPVEEARRVGDLVSSSLAGVLGIASPSKVAYEFGEFFSIGLAKGITNKTRNAELATEDLGNSTISMLEYTRSVIDDVLSAEDDLDPVITPVLDMDQLKKQAENIPGILSSQNGISTRLADISAQSIVKRRAATETAAISDVTDEQVTNYNFTQNNYSPKALSRKEIYRQTRNQFSQFKGATKR